MIKSEKKVKELREILDKNNKIAIGKAIEALREERPFEGAIGLLTALYDNTEDFSIRKSIAGFMNDLKDQTVCSEVIQEIRKQWKPDTISMLVSSCWQSGLNYSEYSIDLAKIFLIGDYITAIECLTVIEESADQLTNEQRQEIVALIEDSPIASSNEIITLKSELLSIIDK